MKNNLFENKPENSKLDAWLAFEDIAKTFIGDHRSERYEQLVTNLVTSFKLVGARMTVKLQFLNSHLSYFPDNCADYSEEQGERFTRTFE